MLRCGPCRWALPAQVPCRSSSGLLSARKLQARRIPEGLLLLSLRQEAARSRRWCLQQAAPAQDERPASTSNIQARIRAAEQEDLAAMHEIERLARGYWTADELRAELGQERTVLLVAEALSPRPRIEGLVLVWCIADEAQVLELAVHPRAWRQGLGRRLMAQALQEATGRLKRTAGRGAAVLEVGVDNTAALALYSSLGFKRTGLRRGYYPDGTDAILMRLPIQ